MKRVDASQKERVKDGRVLVVSDSPDRKHFLSHHIRSHGMHPISYPNYLSAMHALEVDEFAMVVVDLSMPVEGKLELVKRAAKLAENPRVIVIGKTQYLEESGVLAALTSIEKLPGIQGFPEYLTAYSAGQQKSRPIIQ
jgi:DNA-binding NtrC family response regulator